MGLSKAEKVLKEIEEEAKMGRLPHSIVGPFRGQILVEVIRKTKPKRVLEIGTLVGYSAILMGKELNSDAHLITIEKDANSAKIARENIRRAEIPPTVEVLVGDALEVIPKLEGTFDLVFIDAEKSEYLNYLQLVEDKLHKGSVVIADNVDYAPDYLDYVRHSGRYISKYVPAGAGGVEISVKL
ncbi:MAG: O-methyltransferase [Candidatus Bathyarchaeia archaeon]